MDNEIAHKITGLVLLRSLDEAQVAHLFSLSRKLLESVPKQHRQQFELLKLYCDWMLHRSIDRSTVGAEIVARVHHFIADCIESKANGNFANALSAALSLNELRAQLNGLLGKFGSPPIDEQQWPNIVLFVAEIISHCPLKIDADSKKFSAILKDIRRHPLPRNSYVNALTVIKVPASKFESGASDGKEIYCIELTTSDTSKFITPFVRV